MISNECRTKHTEYIYYNLYKLIFFYCYIHFDEQEKKSVVTCGPSTPCHWYENKTVNGHNYVGLHEII